MKKVWIASIFALIFTIALFSGCVYTDDFPVATFEISINDIYSMIHLEGAIGVPFCKAKNHTFVLDTESHENWEDYAIKVPVRGMEPTAYLFAKNLFYGDVEHGVTYYVRAVANCYDFKRPFDDYEEGYYQGEDKTFIVVPYSVIR